MRGSSSIGADGKPTAWRAMPWISGASAAIVLKDSTDRATHAAAQSLLGRLARSSSNGIARVLDRRELDSLGAFPSAAFLVAFKPGFMAGVATRGPLVTPSAVRGMHGYLSDLADMRASFFVAGQGIPVGRSLGEIDMRDVAPTLAAILGVQLRAEGRDLLQTASRSLPFGPAVPE